MSTTKGHLDRFALFAILGLAAILRFYHLGHSSLWSDEGNTWALLSRSFTEIARDAAADIHPPGYYWLLKVWSLAFGTDVTGMRSFSAVLGILLVYWVYRVGKLTLNSPNRVSQPQFSWAPLLAAYLVAVNPFQIYYSQEARMYMLLAVAGAGLIWSLLLYLHGRSGKWYALVGYVCSGILGLWTHYSFPILLAAAGLGYLSHVFLVRRAFDRQSFLAFAFANLIIVLGFLPWLPTAIRRVLAWPAGGASVEWWAGIQLTGQTLLYGPLDYALPVEAIWLLGTTLLTLLGIVALYRYGASGTAAVERGMATTILLWLLLPIGLMFGAGLFTDAFLKFLLAASPAWLLLVAASSTLIKQRWFHLSMTAIVGLGALLLAWQTLPAYYNDPVARDNYAGVAAYIAAVADPQRDLVLLDAPGQQEVWAYYDPGVPTVALPQTRPPDASTTIQTLAELTADRRNVYALFWATDEADPDQIVESWLDQHAYKGDNAWQGNLRLSIYTLSSEMNCVEFAEPVQWGASIQLVSRCQPLQNRLIAGEAALISLHWQSAAPLTARYKVTVQLLDERNQVVAQRDSEPAGGSQPTDSWEPNTVIVDNHGVVVPLGTPPGPYRMIVALYDTATGERLPVGDSDFLAIRTVDVRKPPTAIPATIVPVQQRLNRQIGAVTLVGYSAYRQGMGHAPMMPIAVGDLVEFTLVWQAPDPLPSDWPDELTATLQLGNEQISFALAGPAYSTAQWDAGEILQYRLRIPYDGNGQRPALQIGSEAIKLRALPVE